MDQAQAKQIYSEKISPLNCFVLLIIPFYYFIIIFSLRNLSKLFQHLFFFLEFRSFISTMDQAQAKQIYSEKISPLNCFVLLIIPFYYFIIIFSLRNLSKLFQHLFFFLEFRSFISTMDQAQAQIIRTLKNITLKFVNLLNKSCKLEKHIKNRKLLSKNSFFSSTLLNNPIDTNPYLSCPNLLLHQ